MEFKSEYVSGHIAKIPHEPAFGIRTKKHPLLIDKLYVIVWVDSGNEVEGIGAFTESDNAVLYVRQNRNAIIDKFFEKNVLT